MKSGIYIVFISLLTLLSCKDDDIALFDKTADERVVEAIAALKQKLVSPSSGWKMKYRPEAASGSFYVLLKFNDDNTVNIKTDLGSNDGEFFEQTVTYRIDSSLGLELIIESYSFFSHLFEQDQASFQAEYEFNYVNKTPDDALVFTSKSDFDQPTILLFEEALPTDVDLLGRTVATNLNVLADDFKKFSSSLNLTYTNKDLILFLVMDELKRTLNISAAARKSNTSITQSLDFDSPYIIRGDSLVFDTRFNATVLGNNISLNGIRFSTLTEGITNVCSNPITIHSYNGITSANDLVKLQTGLLDVSGAAFTSSDFYVAPLGNIFQSGVNASAQIAADIAGAGSMQLYYNYDIGDGEPFYAIGFFIQNSDQTTTFALRQFTPTLVDNKIAFSFAPEISIFGNQDTDANIENVNIYLDAMTEGDNTYVFELQDGLYEFYNPCTGWSFVFFAVN